MDGPRDPVAPEIPPIVLVVHDAAEGIEMYERLLDDGENALWITAAVMREAVDYALDLRPDVILCDVDAAGASAGDEFLRQLRGDPRLRQTAVLLVVGSTPTGARAAAADGILLKPVRPEQLVASVYAAAVQAKAFRGTTTIRKAVAAAIARSNRARRSA